MRVLQPGKQLGERIPIGRGAIDQGAIARDGISGGAQSRRDVVEPLLNFRVEANARGQGVAAKTRALPGRPPKGGQDCGDKSRHGEARKG